MKPDTELRRYLTKEAASAERLGEGDKNPSKQTKVPKRAAVEKKTPKKFIPLKRKPTKKAIEIADSDEEYFDVLPISKKKRASADTILCADGLIHSDVSVTAIASPVPIGDEASAIYSTDALSALIAAATAATAAATAAAKAANDAIGRCIPPPPELQRYHAPPSEPMTSQLSSGATVPFHDQIAHAVPPVYNAAGIQLPALLYEHIIQKMKLEELQRRESVRQHTEDKAAFQMQLDSYYCYGAGFSK